MRKFLGGYQGSPYLVDVNSNIKFITRPFTNEQLAAVPAIRPEVTIIHANDRIGRECVDRGDYWGSEGSSIRGDECNRDRGGGCG